jgi:hypothetical protein
MKTNSTFQLSRVPAVAAALAASCVISTSASAEVQQPQIGRRMPVESSRAGTRGTSVSDSRTFYVFGEVQENARASSGARETSDQERAIGDLRRYEKLGANWDGEGATAPNIVSLRAASSFVCLMDRDQAMPEPMLHSSGRAGLYWRSDTLYADLEFFEDGRLAYYVEIGSDRHKGVVHPATDKIPRILGQLLQSA